MSHDPSEIILKPAVNFRNRLMVLGASGRGFDMLCKEPSRGICGGMYRWGRLTLMAKVQNEEDSSWGAGKQWGKSPRNAWHFWPDDGLDKMTIMEHTLSHKPDAPHFTLCHQPLTPQVSVSLASGKGGTILQRLGTPAPDQDIWRIHNDKTISQVMNLELRTRRGLCDRGYGVGSLVHYSTVSEEHIKWLDKCSFLFSVDTFAIWNRK